MACNRLFPSIKRRLRRAVNALRPRDRIGSSSSSSDLENHHASSIFKLLRDKRFNLWSNMTSNEYRTFRSLVISLVLATDMANHASLVERISTYFFFKETSPTSNMPDSKTLLQTLLHAADISNATKPWSIYIQSAEKVMEEFFIQGDLEKIHCADEKPTFDRESTDVVQLQIGFITHIVHPTVSPLESLIGGSSDFSSASSTSCRKSSKSIPSIRSPRPRWPSVRATSSCPGSMICN